jgi:hypothetical protein
MLVSSFLALHLAALSPTLPVGRLAMMTHAELDAGHLEDSGEDAGPLEITDAGPPPAVPDAGFDYDGGDQMAGSGPGDGEGDCMDTTHCVDETDCCEGFQCSGGSCEPLQANPDTCAGQFGWCCGSVGRSDPLLFGALGVMAVLRRRSRSRV